MKKIFAAIVTTTFLLSCSKEDKKADPARDAFVTFQAKYLVCDSVKTTLGGFTTTQVVGKGKGMDITFGPYGNLDIYTNPVTTKKYEFQSPDKIYYWATAYDSNQYYTIQSMSGNKIVLIDTDKAAGKVVTLTFTAE